MHAALQEVVTELETAQAAEAEQLTAELEAAGYPERTRRAQLRRLEERHKRAHRRARTDALLEGITALETVYRDALAGPGTEPLNLDLQPLVLSPRAAATALDACREARQAHRRVQPERDPARRAAAPPSPARGRRFRSPSGEAGRTRYTRRRAGVAQTAEQLTRNEQAKGSSPFSGSIRRTSTTRDAHRRRLPTR